MAVGGNTEILWAIGIICGLGAILLNFGLDIAKGMFFQRLNPNQAVPIIPGCSSENITRDEFRRLAEDLEKEIAKAKHISETERKKLTDEIRALSLRIDNIFLSREKRDG